MNKPEEIYKYDPEYGNIIIKVFRKDSKKRVYISQIEAAMEAVRQDLNVFLSGDDDK